MIEKMDAQTAESVTLDPEDLQIIRALQVAPRIGFAKMASVIGSSEATVARRHRRLTRKGVIRVIGVMNTGTLGQSR
jgi:DNA-binding Lrp family transcriptional regulator